MTLALAPGLTLYFSRHGETQANLAHRFSGKRDTPLTARGRAQAAEIGRVLGRELQTPARIAALSYVSSPLQRACATMAIARQTLGLPPGDFATDPRIQEIDLGRWDQLTDEEARALDPAYFARRAADKWNVPALGGEDYEQVAARLTGWVQSLRAETFAVSHGAATRILRGLFLGLDAARMSGLGEPQGVVFRARGSNVETLAGTGPSLPDPKPMG